MQREQFEIELQALLPDASAAALQKWTEYAQELDQDGTEPEADFYDAAYVELSLIKQHQSIEIATELFNFGERFVFNPFELRGAARFLTEGWALDAIKAYVVENGCDSTAEEYEESREALRAFQNSQQNDLKIFPSPQSEMTENRRRFRSDLAYGIRQLYALEKKLQGQDGAFSDWIQTACEINADFEQPFSETVDGLCAAFHAADDCCGREIAQRLYNSMAVIIPNEIISAANYLRLGGEFESLPELAQAGFFMEQLDDAAVSRAVSFVNAGGRAEKAYAAARRESSETWKPPAQGQTM